MATAAAVWQQHSHGSGSAAAAAAAPPPPPSRSFNFAKKTSKNGNDVELAHCSIGYDLSHWHSKMKYILIISKY